MRVYIDEFGNTVLDFEEDTVYIHKGIKPGFSAFFEGVQSVKNGIFIHEKSEFFAGSDLFVDKNNEEVFSPIEDRFEILDL